MEGGNEFLNIFFGVIHTQRRADGHGNAETFVQRLGAVMSCAHGDAFLIQDHRYVLRMGEVGHM